MAFVNPRQILAQSSGVGKKDQGSGSFSGSVGTIGVFRWRGAATCLLGGPGRVPTGGQGRPDAFQFPYAVFLE